MRSTQNHKSNLGRTWNCWIWKFETGGLYTDHWAVKR